MNFQQFYRNTENRLIDSILSLWTTGDIDTQNYLKYIFNQPEERLLAEPVFQTTFPWEPATNKFGDVTNIFDQTFINALDSVEDAEYKFPKDRFPYKHQVEAWNALINDKKSILVTTGTGSGKTECFMLPVLYDIYKNSYRENGVNAIFLYPLNALISSQKKRIHAWSRSLNGQNQHSGIHYAVYNSKTPENVQQVAQNERFPEIVSRKSIRDLPPQILFTNPTMLEYILVRGKDVPLLENSKGKLRWILLDEAHTLTGSAAAEMAMLIRRILDAFEVDVKDVRFAATSATVGNERDIELLKFMSDLSGKNKDDIKIIKGDRIIPEIPQPTIEEVIFSDFKNLSDNERANFRTVHELRKMIHKKSALTLSEITEPFNIESFEDKIQLIDILAETKVNDNIIFPVRGHFFVRGISGVFVCTNPDCQKHGTARPNTLPGTITTIAGKNCNFCGFALLELVACRSCGNYLLMGEKILKNRREYLALESVSSKDDFYFIEEDEDELANDNQNITSKLFLAKYNRNKRYIDDVSLYNLSSENEITVGSDSGFYIGSSSNEPVCPYCGENTNNPQHFRLSSSFLNRILSDIILEQTPAGNLNNRMLWNGHKYISFSDSRQGTAKISLLINTDNEKNWLRSQVFHYLAKKRKDSIPNTNTLEELDQLISHTNIQIETAVLPVIKQKYEKDLKELLEKRNAIAGVLPVANSRTSWKDLFDHLIVLSELKTLFANSKRFDNDLNGIEPYLKALFFDQFARRLPKERSAENLGIVNITYNFLDGLTVPEAVQKLDLEISKEDWVNLVKISADYLLRYGFFIFLPENVKKYSTSFLKSFTIYSSDSQFDNVKKFPRFNEGNRRQHKLVLLICAGLNFHSIEEISTEIQDSITTILENLWAVLRQHLLTLDGSAENPGYKINIEEKFNFQLSDKLWLCPVKNRLIDTHFKGYSPWISGSLKEENIRHYKLGEAISFPYFPYPYNQNDNGDYDYQLTSDWIKDNCEELRKRGVWNNLLERIIQIRPLYLAGEHSAQQTDVRLKALEDKFESGQLNILNCSTTMEMGVDIGGISAVVMNNVPPSPANYLQRAGRAGRRSEGKSLALTFCTPNPIGANAMNNPLWALKHKIAAPMLSFNSINVTERHINAFFLGRFIQTIDGMNINETVEGFFLGENPIAYQFSNWLSKIEIKHFRESLDFLKKDTLLSDKANDTLLELVKSNLERIISETKHQFDTFNSALHRIRGAFGENSPAYKAVNYQFGVFKGNQVIVYLADVRFISSSGIPRGVINFETTSIDDLRQMESLQGEAKRKFIESRPKPSFHFTRALTEYAPGSNIIIDGWNYVSAGIVFKSEWNEARRDFIQSCVNCGYQHIMEQQAHSNAIPTQCPQCGKEDSLSGLRMREVNGNRFTEFIEPAGFAIDLFQTPTRSISEKTTVQYIEPILIGVQPWSNDSTSIYDIRDSIASGEIMYYNKGNGNGYCICLHCGRTAFDPESIKDHFRLRGGRDNGQSICSGNENHGSGIRRNVIIGGRFKTDFCELRFRTDNHQYSNDENLLWSLGIVLTKTLASYLGIEEAELNFGIKRYDNSRSLFIFDTTPGGAGYSVKFSYFAENIFKDALGYLKACNCQMACTKCLIDRSSQWYIEKLDRQKAINWLEQAVQQTVPEELKSIFPNLESVLGTVREDIKRINYRGDIKRIWFYIDNNVENWDLENASFITDISRGNKKDIFFVFNENINFSENDSNKITALHLQIRNHAKFYLDQSTYQKLYPISKIQLNDGSFIIYYSEKFNNSLNEKWGIADTGYIFKTIDDGGLNLIELNLNEYLLNHNHHDIYLSPSDILTSQNLATFFIEEANQKLKLIDIMQNQAFDIIYSDRYLKSPFANLLLIQFIKGLSIKLNFSVNRIDVKVEKFNELKDPYKLFHNYANERNRDRELIAIANHNGFQNFSVNSNERLPHFRFLTFKNNHKTITIRPDGGIEHGWHIVGSGSYKGLTGSEEISIRKASNHPILFTIVVD